MDKKDNGGEFLTVLVVGLAIGCAIGFGKGAVVKTSQGKLDKDELYSAATECREALKSKIEAIYVRAADNLDFNELKEQNRQIETTFENEPDSCSQF